ncbi:hypothetical protein ACFQ36_01660 [Arthrobacter sp. GCM10027362]|uniref:hypothetical protein n=1 Tax=Arthrobacter sp. GCM10027362 TaxID=3273379 RepID=UPI003639889D
MVQPGAEQLARILRAGREIAFDRVWLVAGPPTGRFVGPVDLYLIVRANPGWTVSANTLRWFREAVERIVPDIRIGVDCVEDLDGLGDPEDLQILLHMVELTDRLTDRDEGFWQVTTASGTVYLLNLTPGRRTLTRLPARDQATADYARIPVADLRRDGETLPLLSIGRLQLGHPGTLVIDVRRDGIPTLRNTTPVVAIVRLEDG